MGVNIYPITLGFDSCYILKDKGIIMIDSGAPKKAKEFMKGLEKASIKPEEIQLIIITHGHWDHIGSAKEIKEIMYKYEELQLGYRTKINDLRKRRKNLEKQLFR